MDEKIQQLQDGLAALAVAITDTQNALTAATTGDETRAQTSKLADLTSEQSRLQTELDNLLAAGEEVRGAGGD